LASAGLLPLTTSAKPLGGPGIHNRERNIIRASDKYPDKLLSEIKVIDADTHYTESHYLWLTRAPRHMRERVAQVAPYGGGISRLIADPLREALDADMSTAERDMGQQLTLAMNWLD